MGRAWEKVFSLSAPPHLDMSRLSRRIQYIDLSYHPYGDAMYVVILSHQQLTSAGAIMVLYMCTLGLGYSGSALCRDLEKNTQV